MTDTQQSSHLATTDVLHASTVYLRTPRAEELTFIRSLWSDPDTMAPVGGTTEFPESEARDWFVRMVEPGSPSNCYCLICSQDDVPVGEISFHNWDSKQRSADLNVKVLATCRGQGYAKAALRAFLEFFFARVGGELMSDEVAQGNRPGQRLLQSIGFERDVSASDVCRMIMTRQSYQERYGELTNMSSATSGPPPSRRRLLRGSHVTLGNQLGED